MREIPSFLSFNDIIGVPVVLIFFFLLIKWLATRYIPEKALLQAFYVGLALRFVGVLLSLFFYLFIEKAADTHTYFYYAKIISSSISNSGLSDFSQIFTMDYSDLPLEIKSKLPVTTFFKDTYTGNTLMIQIASIVSFFSFDSYIAASIIFSLWGYLGVWLIFYRFVQLYPRLYQYFFIFILCWPSIFFFGSGILKEPLCMGSIGILFYYSFGKINGIKQLARILPLVVLASFILYNIKTYLFYSYLIAFLVSSYFSGIHQIAPRSRRLLIYSASLLVLLGGVVMIFVKWDSIIYSEPMLKLMTTIFTITKAQLLLGNSGYDLGEIELTPFGVIKYLLLSLNVGLFRPFIFEITKPMLLISGTESLIMLVLAGYSFYKIKFRELVSSVKSSGLLLFCLIFTILIAIEIGAISFNFGTLVRYKMPLLPFFFSFFFILLDKKSIR